MITWPTRILASDWSKVITLDISLWANVIRLNNKNIPCGVSHPIQQMKWIASQSPRSQHPCDLIILSWGMVTMIYELVPCSFQEPSTYYKMSRTLLSKGKYLWNKLDSKQPNDCFSFHTQLLRPHAIHAQCWTISRTLLLQLASFISAKDSPLMKQNEIGMIHCFILNPDW